jgi:hypothetical protein
MADAKQTLAPSKKEEKKWLVEEEYLNMEFDPGKKYMFELATQNPERELPVLEVDGQRSRPIPTDKFPPYRNIVLTSQIIWKGQRRIVRYYDGCSSIFADEQPKDKEEVDQYIKTTRRREFIKGKFGCYGDEKMLLLYLNICSWNANSPFRTRAADAIFISSDTLKIASEESKKLDLTEKALQLAKEATVTKMMIHASYLGIATEDWDSGNELTPEEIRAKYRKRALQDSENFIESYGNKAIEIKYYINQALIKGLISNKFNPNKATWANSNNVICDISGLRSNEAIGEKLFEFSQLEDGQEFVIQLKAIYDK